MVSKIPVRADALNGLKVPIGRQGEDEAQKIIFDCTEWMNEYGYGTASLHIIRAGDHENYFATIKQDGADVTWTISENDTAYAGTSICQLRWTWDKGNVRTFIFKVSIAKSPTSGVNPPTEVTKGWIDTLVAEAHALDDKTQEFARLAQTLLEDYDDNAERKTETFDKNAQEKEAELNAIKSKADEIAKSVRDDANAGKFDGKTPVRGKDYWTEADKEEIIEDVKDVIPGYDDTEVRNEIGKRMKRYVVRLVKVGSAFVVKDYTTGETLSFDALKNAISDTSNYVVCVYGNSKLRPQYVSTGEMMFIGVDRASAEAKIIRMLVTPTYVQYEAFPLASKDDFDDLKDIVTEESEEIAQLDASAVKSVNGKKPDSNGNVVVEGGYLSLSERIKLLVTDNLMSESYVEMGNGWSGNLTQGYTHTKTNAETLSIDIPSEVGDKFILHIGMSSGVGPNWITIGFSGEYGIDCYNSTTSAYVGMVSNGGKIIITPKDSVTFTITEIEIYKIDENGTNEVSFGVHNVSSNKMPSNLSGYYNTATDMRSLSNSISASRNIAIGYVSLRDIQHGTRNVAIGTYAMPVLISGDRNIGIGADALQYHTYAEDNVAIGMSAMGGTTTVGTKLDVAIGTSALGHHEGNMNTAVGHYSLEASDGSGDENVAVGYYAGHKNASQNVAVGTRSNYFNKGKQNTCVGYRASVGSTSNAYNNSIAIGYRATATKSNQMVLGGDTVTEVVFCGNKKINFNADGTVTWETL